MDKRIAEWIDKNVIAEVFTRYADALDTKRFELLEDIFLPDLKADWYDGRWTQDNRVDAIAFIKSWVEGVVAHHTIGNYLIEVAGDTARASCRVRAHHKGVGDKEHLFEETLGQYSGELVRSPDGKWRFSHYKEQLIVILGTFDVFARA